MVSFVCPECDEEISNGEDSVISQAINHMQSEHGREVSQDYVRGNMEAHED